MASAPGPEISSKINQLKNKSAEERNHEQTQIRERRPYRSTPFIATAYAATSTQQHTKVYQDEGDDGPQQEGRFKG
jgi:hypothetical protein